MAVPRGTELICLSPLKERSCSAAAAPLLRARRSVLLLFFPFLSPSRGPGLFAVPVSYFQVDACSHGSCLMHQCWDLHTEQQPGDNQAEILNFPPLKGEKYWA